MELFMVLESGQNTQKVNKGHGHHNQTTSSGVYFGHERGKTRQLCTPVIFFYMTQGKLQCQYYLIQT